jgi:glycosyltransferase involved in cell wall biosynthesis
VGDAAALADRIRDLLRDPGNAREMGANCRRIAVEEYSLEVQARAYSRHYEAILAGSAVQ